MSLTRSSVDAMVARCNAEFGPVDVLVNNAGGVAHPRTSRNWTRKAGNGNRPQYRWCSELLPGGGGDMLGRSTGSIINISSNSSLLGEAAANVVHYGGVKGFVNSFSKALAWEWAKKGVRVNNVCPGWIVPEHEDNVGEGSFWNRFGFDSIGKPDDMKRWKRVHFGI
ncbi:MAG: SDR family oxidoreductase [Gammaproteobacteria bacterium]|nr:SDR family oxidoreductase [Gammaproteobacteria bacterium]